MNRNGKSRTNVRRCGCILCARFRWLLGLLVVYCGLTACSDDEVKVTAEVVLPSESVLSAGLEAYSYTLEMQITSDTEWRVEFDEAGDEIAYALPASGTGNATVKLCILDNLESVRRTGQMTVVFPADPAKNRSCTLTQKAAGTDENYDEGLVGERRYGIGYGFNLTKGVSPRGLCFPVLKKEVLRQEKGAVQVSPGAATVVARTYCGSTIKELDEQFLADCRLKGSQWGIESDASLVFDTGNYKEGKYEYALSYMDAVMERINLMNIADRLGERTEVTKEDGTVSYQYKYLVQSVGNALNAPDDDKKYPSTDEGFKRLLDKYGTHLIVTANLGGRLLYSLCVDASTVNDHYSLEAFASLANNGVVQASDTVLSDYGSSFAGSITSVRSRVQAWGGDKQAVTEMAGTTGAELAKGVEEWKNSLKDEANRIYIGFNSADDLLPLYELVQDSRRAALLEDYIESGRYAASFKQPTYELGVVGVVDGLDRLRRELDDTDGSLMMNVCLGSDANQVIGCICSEYIPRLDEKSRVLVVYPVLDGRVKFNMGYFTGNDLTPPCRVENRKGETYIYPISGEQKGERTRLYLRGSSVSDEEVDSETDTQTAVVEQRRAFLPGRIDGYPLVKLNQNVWMRSDYASKLWLDGYPTYDLSTEREGTYYYCTTGKFNLKDGWRSPSLQEVKAVRDCMERYSLTAEDLIGQGDLAGLHLLPNGRMDVVESLAEMYYMFCEEGCAFLATGDGEWLKYEPSSGVATFGQWRGFHALPLRYVHPVTDF